MPGFQDSMLNCFPNDNGTASRSKSFKTKGCLTYHWFKKKQQQQQKSPPQNFFPRAEGRKLGKWKT